MTDQEKLKIIRSWPQRIEAMGLLQNEFAALIGMDKAAVSRIINIFPSEDKIMEIEAFFEARGF